MPNILDERYKQELEAKLLGLYSLGLPETVITAGDLNEFTEPGIYRTESGSTWQSLENCPVEVGFKLIVEYGATAARRLQRMYTSDGREIIRNGNVSVSPSEWTEWGQYITHNSTIQAPMTITDANGVPITFSKQFNAGMFWISVEWYTSTDYPVSGTKSFGSGMGILQDGVLIADVHEIKQTVDGPTNSTVARYTFTYDVSALKLFFTKREGTDNVDAQSLINYTITITPTMTMATFN